MDAGTANTYQVRLDEETRGTVLELPILIHHGGAPSTSRTVWLLVEPVVEELTMRADGRVERSSGQVLALDE